MAQAAHGVRRVWWWSARQARNDQLDDPGAVVLAGAAVLGALAAVPVPVAAAVGLGLVSLVLRRVALVWCSAAILASALCGQAWAGLARFEPGPFAGEVALATDPEPAFGAWRAEVVAGDHRVELWARGAGSAVLRHRAAGQRVQVVGRLERTGGAPWLTARHVAGRLVADEVGEWRDGGPLSRVANGLRAIVRRGAEPLPPAERALLLGFVLGDVRDQPPEVADDFDAAGLQHLLVVSGQNVAFVLVVLSPGLRRLGPRGRLVATVGVLALFATVTRYEPSVLRATAMAGLAVLGATLGRPSSGVRTLALAVAALVVADPFLVHSVAFRLSVAASAGILVVAPGLARALPGPRVLTEPLSVTLAAQAAVAPVLIPTFGPMPVAAVPANLLAGPVAGLVMMWGASGGVVAGVVGGPVAGVLQWPTRLGLGWVAGVARWAADLPLGGIGMSGVIGVAVAVGASVAARARGRPVLAVLLVAVALGVAAAPAVGEARRVRPAGAVELRHGVLWRGGDDGEGDRGATVLVVDGTADPGVLLEDLRRAGVDRVDLAVLESGGPRVAGAVAVLGRRVAVEQLWAPEGHDVTGAVVPPRGRVAAGGLVLDVTSRSPSLEVEVSLAGAP